MLALGVIFGVLTGASTALLGVGFYGALTFVTSVTPARPSPGCR